MNTKGSKHLTIDDRKMIENLLSKGLSCKEIAFEIGKDERTVSREIKGRRVPKENGRYGLYGKYDKTECKMLTRFPYVCSSCNKRSKCFKKIWYFYNADKAQEDYEKILVESRTGMDLSEGEYDIYNQALAEGVKKGQSIHHIVSTNADIPYSERTVYRHIDEQKVDVMNIDLRRKVKFKQRKHYEYQDDNFVIRQNRRYVDFLRIVAAEQPVSIAEIDTVEGPVGKHKCLLTIHFTAAHFMMIFVLELKTKENVSKVFAYLQDCFGPELYSTLFHITLTDRGSEFCDPDAIELDHHTGEKLCNLFYCNSYSSYQKGSIEENHGLIRYIIPKGLPFDDLTQDKAFLMSSHINCYHRESVDATPYELAEALFGKEFLNKTKTRFIPPNLVNLKHNLLH